MAQTAQAHHSFRPMLNPIPARSLQLAERDLQVVLLKTFIKDLDSPSDLQLNFQEVRKAEEQCLTASVCARQSSCMMASQQICMHRKQC